MATFLRAIKAGVIHFRHAVTLLTHYGRLGPVFDQCVKIIVEILREEGMYKSNGEIVVEVVLQALREVFLPYLSNCATLLTCCPVFPALHRWGHSEQRPLRRSREIAFVLFLDSRCTVVHCEATG